MCQFDDDNWVETAMADVNLVANFLLTMKKTSSPPSSSLSPPLNLHWTVRQRRSKSRTRKMKTDSTRASPTTPLSWSAATSASGADGNEESSRLTKPVHTSRSKVEEQCEASGNKRLRKKRSLPDLLEEERLLLKERGNLKDRVASMHLNVEKQRANNESLKKMKLDLVSQTNTETARISLVSQKNTETARISLVSQKNTETAIISLVSGKAVLHTPQVADTNRGSASKLVQSQTVQEKKSVVITEGASSKLVQPQTVQEKKSVVITEGASSSKLLQPQTVQEKESAVITEGASSSVQREIHRENNNRELPFLLPDLNLPPEEEQNCNTFS
ncbi:uncharacterized protein LOC127105376 [Lathyrus oleraceus]|uniref:Uncharacterized protein n=2 Tax=Pisum sativum TaxID=3888 RepID=A0A9D4VXY4_PEA|nr:uncharacterized protein LOC127105376 [Pisum sativum]KAI5392399.1 hypothetical protein KIW84_076982 [Pisum sativum]